jgi:predicted acetyltransferase
MDERIELIEPTESLRDEFESFCRESGGIEHLHGCGPMSKSTDFSVAVRLCLENARGINVPVGWVRSTTFWLVRDGRTILGTASLRHALNDYLERLGGHIGYSVRPTERRKGYATLMLGKVLDHARKLGLAGVLITCDKNNIASASLIQNNGGVLEDEIPSDQPSRAWTQRYWIGL